MTNITMATFALLPYSYYYYDDESHQSKAIPYRKVDQILAKR